MAALRGKALIAYLVVCVFWGSTYLAIRVGVGELPPFLFAGLRFLIAGFLLLGLALALGDRLPRRLADWRTEAIVGLLLLAGGNTFVVWAEQFTPSGTANVLPDRKSTRLNSSHTVISYAVFCLKKKKQTEY